MTEAVSCQSLIAEAWVHTWVNPCGICGGQSGTETDFSPSSSVFPCQYHSTVALHTNTSSGNEQVCWWLQFRDIVSPHPHEWRQTVPFISHPHYPFPQDLSSACSTSGFLTRIVNAFHASFSHDLHFTVLTILENLHISVSSSTVVNQKTKVHIM
jgi:hypothetical protein